MNEEDIERITISIENDAVHRNIFTFDSES